MSKTFRVQVTETITKTYTVEAGSEEEAREQALQIFDSTDNVDDDKYNMDVESITEV